MTKILWHIVVCIAVHVSHFLAKDVMAAIKTTKLPGAKSDPAVSKTSTIPVLIALNIKQLQTVLFLIILFLKFFPFYLDLTEMPALSRLEIKKLNFMLMKCL